MDTTQELSIKKTKDIAAAYIRVSTTKQRNEGYSIENQEILARQYAEEQGWDLQRIIIEDKPASKIYGNDTDTDDVVLNFNNRPEFKELLTLAESKEFQHLITYSRDRLTRVFNEQNAIEIFLSRFNIDIHYTRSGENIKNENSNMTRFINSVLSSFCEYESSLLSSRIKDTNKNRILNGFWAGGRTPLGFIKEYATKSNGKGPTLSLLKKSDFESLLIKEIFNLYMQGYVYSKIADIMNNDYPFIKWTKSKIESIITNQTYTGQIAWNRRGGRRQKFKKYDDLVLSKFNSNTEIISKDDWDSCSKLREQRLESNDPYLHLTPFILKDKLVCSKCNNIMKSKNPGKNKSNIYRCMSCKNELDNKIIPARNVHYEFINQIKNLIKINDYENIWLIYNAAFSDKTEKFTQFIDLLNCKIVEHNSFLRNLEDAISIEPNDVVKKALENQKIITSKLLIEYNKTKRQLENKYNIPIMKKEIFVQLLDNYIPAFFEYGYKEDNDDEFNENAYINYQFKLRQFILLFIDKVYIDYENKTLSSMKIIYKPPEFI